MNIQPIEANEAVARAVSVLGLDSSIDLFSPEGVCASLRRAASFLCPASPRQLVEAVLDVLTPLNADVGRDDVADALERLTGAGDLLELRTSGARTRLLFLGPPSYVERQPGHFLLLGIRPSAARLVDEGWLGSTITYESHTRKIDLDQDSAIEDLAAAGLHRLTREQWTKAPRQDVAAIVVERARDRLRSARAPGQVTGLMVIDSTTSVRYYNGRWREPVPSDKGVFIGRRPQAYGAPVWCIVDFADGVPQALLDLPLDSSVAPGWDDGRRLQAALDAHRGSPQEFRARPTRQPQGDWILDFFAPLPSWAERYLDLAGSPVTKSQGALFSYRVPDGAESETRAFLSSQLWIQLTEEVQDR